MEKFRKSNFYVITIPHRLAANFIRDNHYARGAGNTSLINIGLFERESGELVGASMWNLPPPGVIKRFQCGATEMLCLSRLAVHSRIPTNGASFLIGASIKKIKRARNCKNIKCLITFADEMMNHSGAIYRATNWKYDGETTPYYAWIDRDGKLISKYSTKSRTSEFMDAKYTRIGPFKKHRFIMPIKCSARS